MKNLLLLLLAPALLFQSCATVLGVGGKEQIPVNVNVEDYTVYVNAVPVGKNVPFITVRKNDIVTVTKDGYSDSVTQIQGKFTVATLGNLILGGVIGICVDAAGGRFTTVTTPFIKATLKENKN